MKKFNQFNESVLDKLQGPNIEEMLKQFKQMNPTDALFKCVHKNTGFLQGVKQALEDGADINARDKALELTPLEYALNNNQIEIAVYLLDNGAIITHDYTDFFLLKIVVHSDLETLLYILKKTEFPLDTSRAKKFLEYCESYNKPYITNFLEKYIVDVERLIKNYIKSI